MTKEVTTKILIRRSNLVLQTSNIDDVMVEITSNCIAMCLDCGRNLDGVNLNPNLKFGTAGNMKLETFKSVFNSVGPICQLLGVVCYVCAGPVTLLNTLLNHWARPSKGRSQPFESFLEGFGSLGANCYTHFDKCAGWPTRSNKRLNVVRFGPKF